MLTGWSYRKIITIDHTKVLETLNGFVYPVVLDSSNFSFNAARSDGFDIRFTDIADTLLDFERVSHDAVNKLAEYWVACPQLSTLVDVIIFMPYGNPSAADAATQEATWDATLVMVQHMNDGVDNAHITDSTSNNNDGTKKGENEPIEAAGKIGYGQTFDGGDDYVSFGSPSGMPIGNSTRTMTAWFKTENNGTVVAWGSEVDTQASYMLISGGKLYFGGYADGHDVDASGTITVIDNNWHHGAIVYDGDVIYLYVDGTFDISKNIYTLNTVGTETNIGKRPQATDYFTGKIDEVCISNIARSAAWILAEFYAGSGTLGSMTDDWGIPFLDQCRFLLGMLPYADGTFTRQDAEHLLNIFPDLTVGKLIGGNLTFNGTLDRATFRAVGGDLTFNGILGRYTKRGLGGDLTFNGTLTRIHIDVISVGGNLNFFGSLQALNPDWLLIPDYLVWMGVWDAGTTYAADEAVLYVEGDRHFAFVSKAGTNLNHLPTDVTWWYRLNPMAWGKV